MSFLIRVWIPLLSVPLSWSNYLPVVLLPNAIISRVKISIYEVGSWGGVRAWGWRTQHSVCDSDLNDSDVVVKAELNHNWRSQWKVRKWAMNWSWLSINVSILLGLPRWGSEKATATHSSTLAWKIPWMEEPARLQSMGSLRVRHNWAISLSLFTFMHWGRKWQPTPVFLPGESQGQRSLVGCLLWGRTESNTTEAT